MIEKKLRRFVKQRPTRHIRSARDFDEATLHQSLQHALNRHTADSFDIGARNRLPISDDRERLERGRREPRRFCCRKKLSDPGRIHGIARKLPAFGFFDEAESAMLVNVFGLQPLNRGGNLRFVARCELVGRKFIIVPASLDCCANICLLYTSPSPRD